MITLSIILISVSFASFGNNLISFFTKNGGAELKRSLCICGKKELKNIELIPVFSYLYLMGKCRSCNRKLPLRFLFVEIVFGLIGLVLYLSYGLSLKFTISFFILFVLIVIAIIDFISYIIPNPLLIVLFLIALLNSILTPDEILTNLIIVISLIIFFLVNNVLISNIKKKDGIGYGDIKLIALLPFLFSPILFFIGLWISSLSGLLGYSINKKNWKERIPFGFFLWIGFTVTELLNTQILTFYYKLVYLWLSL